jgi:ketosteroid isomerase-like protein
MSLVLRFTLRLLCKCERRSPAILRLWRRLCRGGWLLLCSLLPGLLRRRRKHRGPTPAEPLAERNRPGLYGGWNRRAKTEIPVITNVALRSKFWGSTVHSPSYVEQAIARDALEDLMITEDYVRKIFKGLEQGDGAGFFEHVDDKVDWIVEGTHPLAGHYKSKSDFLAGTFAKLGKVLPNGAQLVVEHLLVKDDQAVVELHSLATAKNGMRFDNRYCWVLHFDGNTIDRVRAYLDSTMVARLFEENPI